MADKPIKSGTVFKLKWLVDLWMRILAIVFLFFTVRYWILAVGISDPNIRFDTMQTHWKVVVAILSICYPIAALGLWGLFRWGFVMWFLTAGTELVMYLLYTDLFGHALNLVVFHIASLLVWALYVLIQYLEVRREQLNSV